MRSTSLPQVRFLTAIGILSLSAGLFMTQPAFSASPELIAREHIFGNPSRTSPQLNADGSLLAFLAPREGVMNLWVCPTGKFDEAKALTAEKKRPLSAYFWSANGEDILYIQDSGGDENFLLYGVNAKTGTTRKLTDFSKTRVNFYGTSWIRSDEVVIGLNNRDPKWHDAWLLNIKTGALTLLHENTERLSGYVVDDGLRLQYAVRTRPDGGWELLKFGSDGKALQVSATVEYEDADNTSLVGLTQDGTTLYLRDSRGRDKAVLKAIAIDSGKETILAEDSRVDISGAFRHPVTGRAEAYRVNYLRSEWHVLDKSRTADFEFLTQQFQNEWTPVSVTKDTRLWIIVRGDATTPGAFFLYDRQAKTVTKLFTSRPDLEGKPLVPMHPVEIKSRDGLTLVSYLTLPISADSNGDGKPEQKAPLVLLVHGGPWARDAYGFNGMHQWLANRGYAVLSVNFRGSTGFGKAFIRASDKEWAGKMHNDLLDAVDWAVKGGDCAEGQDRHHGWILRRIRHSGRAVVHSRRVCLRCRYRGPCKSADFVEHDPSLLGSRPSPLRARHRRRRYRGRTGTSRRAFATHARELHQEATADWPRRERSASQASGIRPDRRSHEGAVDSGDVRAVSRRRTRLRSPGE